MKPVRNITAEEENFRVEMLPGTMIGVIRRDPVEPAPIGSIILRAYRVTGYDRDCDGSLMARLKNIDRDGKGTGCEKTNQGLYPQYDIVATLEEWRAMFGDQPAEPTDGEA